MHRSIRNSGLFILAGVAAAASGALAPDRTFYCTGTTTTWTDNRNKSETEKIWLAPPNQFRFEQTAGDKSRVTILNGADFWMFSPSQKRGYHRRLSAEEIAPLVKSIRSGVDMLGEFRRIGAKKAGEQKIDGRICEAYKRASKEGLTTTLYVLPGPDRLVRRREQNGILRAADTMGAPMRTHIVKSVTDYGNWQFGKPMPESLFRPPAGITIQEGVPARPPTMAPMPSIPKRKL